jgi:hypothetical protein
MGSFTLQANVAAPIDVVFDVLTDHRRYDEFTPIRVSSLEREGETHPNGVGAIRTLKVLGPPIREQVVGFERPTKFSYRMLSGMPVREHVGTVELAPVATGTHVDYRVDTSPSLPIPDAAWTAGNKPAISRLLKGVVTEAERRARTGS